jgi:HK97 family phage major capsid protein
MKALIAAASEKAARCLNAAKEIQTKHPDGNMPADVLENFNKAMADFKEANNEFQRLKGIGDQFSELNTNLEFFNKPQHVVMDPPVLDSHANPQVTVKEAFGRVVRQGRYDEKSGRVVVPGIPETVVANCLDIQREAFRVYLRSGESGLQNYADRQKHVDPREIHALTSGDQTLGGFLVPEDVRNQIIMADAGAAVLANLCRIENTGRDALSWPKVNPHSTDGRRTSGFAGDWKRKASIISSSGGVPSTQDQPTFAREKIPVHDWTPNAIEVETNLLEDADANVESIIAQTIGECLAFDKDDVILAGTGAGEPEGVLNCGCSTIASQDADGVAYGGIIGMYVGLPQQYRKAATWVMHSWTMGSILQLNTGTGGVYLFPPNQWNGTILNRPVVFIDSDDIDKPTAEGGTTFTAADNPIIFGDWKRYIIAQRQMLRIQRLVERFAPNVGLLPSSRIGGQVVLTQAFRLMTVSA